MVRARLCEPYQDALLQKQFKLKQGQIVMLSNLKSKPEELDTNSRPSMYSEEPEGALEPGQEETETGINQRGADGGGPGPAELARLWYSVLPLMAAQSSGTTARCIPVRASRGPFDLAALVLAVPGHRQHQQECQGQGAGQGTVHPGDVTRLCLPVG